MEGVFVGLPEGTPLEVDGGRIVARRSEPLPKPLCGRDVRLTGPVPAQSPEAEVASLYERRRLVEWINGVTLVAFLILQFAVGWACAWIVWPSQALALSIPRFLLRFDDDDEKIYEELEDSHSEARAATSGAPAGVPPNTCNQFADA